MVRSVLAVAVVLVLAGCSGFAGADATESVTPAPVPTEPAPYPPGISEHRIVPSVVASAHARTLATNSYTMTTRERITTAEGKHIYGLYWEQNVSNGSATYRGQFQQNGSQDRLSQRTSEVDYWTNGTLAAVQYRDERGQLTRYYWTSEQTDPLGDLSGSQYIESIFGTVEMSVVRHGDDGRAVLRGTTFRDPEEFVTPLSVSDPTNVTVRMVVRPDGVVVFQRVAYDARVESDTVRVVRETRITAIGSTTARQPDWVKNSSRADSPSVLNG